MILTEGAHTYYALHSFHIPHSTFHCILRQELQAILEWNLSSNDPMQCWRWLQAAVGAIRLRALLWPSVLRLHLSSSSGEMLQPPVFGWNEGLFPGASNTVQTMDGFGQEITGHHSRQVCLLLLQSIPPSVLFDEWTKMVSYFLWGMSSCQEVSI